MNADETIKRILADDVFIEIPVAEMGENESLRDVFGLDSVGFVELRVQCQERFAVEISDEDFTPENFATIASVSALVTRLGNPGETVART